MLPCRLYVRALRCSMRAVPGRLPTWQRNAAAGGPNRDLNMQRPRHPCPFNQCSHTAPPQLCPALPCPFPMLSIPGRTSQLALQVEIAPNVLMPTVGYGTAGLVQLTADAVFTAIRTGYRLVDSAQVGRGRCCEGHACGSVWVLQDSAQAVWTSVAASAGALGLAGRPLPVRSEGLCPLRLKHV